MSTEPIQNPAPEPLSPADPAGLGVIAYRITVLLLLGACAWFLSRPPQSPPVPANKPTQALLGNSWQHVYEFDKQQRTAELDFRTDGSIVQTGSGAGKFEIISPEEISLDPFPQLAALNDGVTPVTGGLFGWPSPTSGPYRWSVEAVGEDLLLQRKSTPHDRVVLHRMKKPDARSGEILQTLQRIQNELTVTNNARKSENEAIRHEILLLREAEKKRVDEGKK